MPIYGYACKECGHQLDALQKMSDAPLVDCPECGAAALRRQLSAPRFRLKGQGWYETDFKKDKQRNIAGESERATADDKSSGDKPAESSPEKKTEQKDTVKASSDKPAKASTSETKPAKKAASKSSGSD